MKDVEWWVMRIVRSSEQIAQSCGVVAPDIERAIARGDLQLVNGDIVEPIECFDGQEDAIIRAQREHARTGCPHKIVLNAEL